MQSDQRLLKSLLLIGAVAVAARAFGWSGPGATVQTEPRILVPAFMAIMAWGIYRALRSQRGRS